jgi:hypothetical protein
MAQHSYTNTKYIITIKTNCIGGIMLYARKHAFHICVVFAPRPSAYCPGYSQAPTTLQRCYVMPV